MQNSSHEEKHASFVFDQRLSSFLQDLYPQIDTFVIDIFDNYVSSILEMIAELDRWIIAKDYSRADVEAHKFVNTFQAVGLKKCVEINDKLRKALRNQDDDQSRQQSAILLQEVKDSMPIVELELERLRSYVGL